MFFLYFSVYLFVNCFDFKLVLFEHSIIYSLKWFVLMENDRNLDSNLSILHDQHTASIFWRGKCLYRFQQDKTATTTNVVWDLPFDTDKTRDFVREKIVALTHMPVPDWVLYANSIVPLVVELQSTNTSFLADDNLLDYLIEVVQDKLGGSPCVIDEPLYLPLATNAMIRLHPLLAPKDWVTRIALLAKNWDCTKAQLWIADMTVENSNYFIQDTKHNRVFVERNYYEKLLLENNINLLKSILPPPLSEINTVYKPSTHSDFANPPLSKVTFNPNIINNPLHSLYLRHGVLWLQEPELLGRVLKSDADMKAILMQAHSLVSVYPEISFRNNASITFPLLAFQFEKNTYYYHPEDFLFNVHFQPLFDTKWDRLKSKIRQLIMHSKRSLTNIPEQEIKLTHDDRLAIKNRNTGRNVLCNGLGQSVDPLLTSKNLQVNLLEYPYYLIKENSETQMLFHNTKGILLHLSNNTHRILENTNLLAEYDEWKIIKLYDLDKNKYLAPKATTISISGKYILGKYPDKIWKLFSDSGDILFLFTHSLDSVVHFCVEKEENNNVCNLSVMNESGVIYWIQLENKIYKQELTLHLGFPVQFIVYHDKEDLILENCDDKTSTKFSNLPLKIISKVPQYSASEFYNVYRKLISAKDLQRLDHWLIKPDKHLILFNARTLKLMYLSLDWNLEDITDITTLGDNLIISSLKNFGTEFAYINADGTTLLNGNTMYYLNPSNSTHLFCDGFVYNAQGQQVTQKKAAQARTTLLENNHYLLLAINNPEPTIYHHESYYYEMYDMNGQPINLIKQFNAYKKIQQSFIYYSLDGNRLLASPYCVVKEGLVKNNTSSLQQTKNNFITLKSSSMTDYILTQAGYAFFNETIPADYTLLRVNTIRITNQLPQDTPAILTPFPINQLLNPDILSNIIYLNKLPLDAYKYGLSLRFIHWPALAFQMLIPYVSLFTYTAGKEKAADYQTIIRYSYLQPQDRSVQILQLFNLIQILIHEYDNVPIAKKLIDFTRSYDWHTVTKTYNDLIASQYRLLTFIPTLSKTNITTAQANKNPGLHGLMKIGIFGSVSKGVTPKIIQNPQTALQNNDSKDKDHTGLSVSKN